MYIQICALYLTPGLGGEECQILVYAKVFCSQLQLLIEHVVSCDLIASLTVTSGQSIYNKHVKCSA